MSLRDELKAEQENSTREWDEMAGVWDEQAAFYRDSLAEELWDHVEFASERKDLVVLDFGCGSGLLTECLQEEVGKVICIDASPAMMEKVFEKIRDYEWTNVEGFTAVLSEPDDHSDKVKDALESLKGSVDLVVATPGRLIDFHRRGDLHLDLVEILVVDEAERMIE